MMMLMLIAGVGCLLAGLLAIGFGIPVKEFSFGNTLILTGAVAACTGLMTLGMWVIVRELRTIAARLGSGMAEDRIGTAMQTMAATAPPGEGDGFLFSRDQPAGGHPDMAGTGMLPPAPAPWLEAAARDRAEPALPEPAAPAPKPRRNLMFSSISRKERERAQVRAADQSAPDVHSASVPTSQLSQTTETPPPAFEDTLPKMERSKSADAPPQRRAGRAPSTFSEATAGPPGADSNQQGSGSEAPPVTVLKSGVVDGMAYSLYSDGSIEAQMPEGMMRFASIDELRAHLDQRP
jgi:hypothetical protein